jgi:hypothetical protein
MGSAVQGRRPWQDVVAEKRRIQAESLARFAPQGDGADSKAEDSLATKDTKSVDGTELVARLTRGEVSCESLIKSHIEKSVKIMQNFRPSQQKLY